MSVRVMSAVWHEAPYREGPLLVLLALADWANDDGWCWPSVPAIAGKSRLTERQVYNVLAQLEKDGVVLKQPGGGRGKPTRYRVLTAALAARVNPETISGFTDVEKPVQKPVNPEVGCRVSGRRNPEIGDIKTLKLATSPIGRTVREPSGTTNAPITPTAAPRGTSCADSDSAVREHAGSDPAIEEAVAAVMRGCGWTVRRVERSIRAQLQPEARGEDGPGASALRMVENWRLFIQNRDRMARKVGALEFIAEGYWRGDARWPWDAATRERLALREQAGYA